CRSDRDPRSGCGADGRARPRHFRFTASALDTGQGRTGQIYAAHSCAAPARSNVRAAAKRPAIPKALRRKTKVISGNFFAEVKRRNVAVVSAREFGKTVAQK